MIYNIKNDDVEILESCLLCEGTNLVEISNVCDDNGTLFFETSCCEDCGFVFRSKRSKLEWFLNAWSTRSGDSDEVVQKLTVNTELENMRYDRYTNLAIVLEDCVTNKNILDVGCGPATGLRAFDNRGWDVTGVEPDPVRAKIGVEQHKLNIHNCTIENFSNSKQCDVATLIHALEHIHDPEPFLRSVIDKIVDGGFLYIEVPDLFSTFVELRDSLYLEHMNNFSKSTLQAIGRGLGLNVKKTFVTKTHPHGHNHIAVLFQKDVEKQWQDKEINISDLSYGTYVKKGHQAGPSEPLELPPRYVESVKKIYRKTRHGHLPLHVKLNFQTSGISDIAHTCKFDALSMEGNKLKVVSVN
jgi:2-polyprenyl-3-methyl-5-hydroxy-6-metoxy-1,4-benzoquinol methylase